MDKQSLVEFGVDYDAALMRCVNSVPLYEMLLNSFAADLHIDDVTNAYAAKDWEALFALAHEIKGVSGNLGLTKLYRVSADVTQTLRDKRYEALDALIAELQSESKRFLSMMAQA